MVSETVRDQPHVASGGKGLTHACWIREWGARHVHAGFDFLGNHFSRKQLRKAQKTFEQFEGKVDGLYERTASPLKRDEAVVINYVQRWLGG